jgi:SH3-like domain-containing protein
MRILAPLILLSLLALPVLAQEAPPSDDIDTPGLPNEKQVGGPFPRYATLKKGEVNVRSGPGNQYPTLWVYQRTGYPVLLLARYDNYYKIRDVEAEEGWVYVGMVSARKGGLVGGRDPVPLYHKDDPGSDIVARLAPGVVVGLEECDAERCKVETGGYRGWVSKRALLMVE